MSLFKSRVLTLGFFFGMTVLVSWPLTANLSNTLPVGANPWFRADIDLLVWILAWTSRAIVSAPLEIFEATLFHPAPMALTASENLIGLTPISTPALLASNSPLFTYNFTLLAVTFLTASTTYWAVRDYEDSLLAGLLAGSLLAFNPQLLHEWARLHESAVSLFPLVFLLSFRVARNPGIANFCGLILATSIQILAGVYLAFILGTFAAGLAPGLIAQARASGRTGTLPLVGLLLGTVVPGIVSIPYFASHAGGTYPELEQALAIAAIYSYSPLQSLTALATGTGFITMPLAILGLANKRVSGAVRFSLLFSLTLGVILTAGPNAPLIPGTEIPGIYWILSEILPGFSTMRAPARFLVISHISLALCAGFGSAMLLRGIGDRAGVMARSLSGTALLGAAILLILSSQTQWPIDTSVVPRGPFFTGAYQWLAEEATEGAVLELPAMQSPLEKKRLAQTGRAMRWSLHHGRPLINGYSGHPPPSHSLLMTWAQRMTERSVLDDFCQYTDLRWIIVHYGLLEGPQLEIQETFAAAGLRERKRFGQDVVYEMPRACGKDINVLRQHSLSREATTLRGEPMRKLVAGEKIGSLQVHLLLPWHINSVHWVDLTIQNDSDVTWPGMTTDRTHAVIIDARWLSAEGVFNPCCSLPMLLGQDLAPGEVLRTPFLLYAPGAPGDWTLEIGLKQQGSGWFRDTGGTGVQSYTVPLVRRPQLSGEAPARAAVPENR